MSSLIAAHYLIASGREPWYWDGGPQTSPAPPFNIPDRGGTDPHYFPRQTVPARNQKSAFLSPNGAVINVCGAAPCRADGYH
jgi:hypothetical protein